MRHILNMKDKIIDGHTIGLIPAKDRLRLTIEFLERIEQEVEGVDDSEKGSAIKAVARDRKIRREFVATVEEMEAVVTLYKGIQIFIDRMMKDFKDLSDYEKRRMGIITENIYMKRQGEKAVVKMEEKNPLLLEEGQETEK